jgi:hypothetical protein
VTEKDKPTALEKVTGSLATESAATVVAALVGSPLAALLPVLTNALANGRHRARLEATLSQMNATLTENVAKVQKLSDEQYKVVNEAILAAFQTLDAQKLEYLRRVVRNGLDQTDLVPQEAAALSRIVRDISAEELDFLIEHANVRRIQVAKEFLREDDVLKIPSDSPTTPIFLGLISLGLLMPGEPTWDDSDLYRFSSLKDKLLDLVRDTGE